LGFYKDVTPTAFSKPAEESESNAKLPRRKVIYSRHHDLATLPLGVKDFPPWPPLIKMDEAVINSHN
jgi:hypothetical protein